MGMVGRKYSADDAYRYGFNSKEKTSEISADAYDFGARIYDGRIGRWLSVDQYDFETPGWTPYRFGFDNPLLYLDKDGNKEFPNYNAYVEYAQQNKMKVLTEANMYKQGHWLYIHRIRYVEQTKYKAFSEMHKARVFERAAEVNTSLSASSEYIDLPQREAYYIWATDFFGKVGSDVQWMTAAASAVSNLQWLFNPFAEVFGYSNKEIRNFVKAGNKVILDDIMPKIKELMLTTRDEGPLEDRDAIKWDAQTLADEQAVIQPLYERLSPKSVKILQKGIESAYDFEGDILNVADRWVLGMREMGYEVTADMMPKPGGNYKDVKSDIKKKEP